MQHATRFDAPFWAALVLGVFAVAAVSFLGLAAAAEDMSHAHAQVLEHKDPVY